ncbi:hypothetical protein PENTCL1PPCAC_2256, partial [Pristionchus entomophagus]
TDRMEKDQEKGADGETKETQYDALEKTEMSIQTESVEKDDMVKIDKDSESDGIFTVEVESQTEEECNGEKKNEGKEKESERQSVVNVDIQTEIVEEVSMCDRGMQTDSHISIEIECQTEGEEEELQDEGAQPQSPFSFDRETQTDVIDDVEMIERECQSDDINGEKEERWTQSQFNTIDQECQYFVYTVEESTQIDEREMEEMVISRSEIGSETDSPSVASASTQSLLTLTSAIPIEIQTEKDIRHRKIQTDEIKRKIKKKIEKEVRESQTDRDLLRETNCSAQTCSPPPFPVGLSVMDASTQCIPHLVTTSQTQYSSSCIRETSVQTDLNEGICAESQVDPFDVSPLSPSFLSLSNMIDVGIQTGVLARVEHMYATESKPEIIRGIAELHRSNSVNSQDSDVSSIFRGSSSVRMAPAMVGRDRRDSVESIERRPSTSSTMTAPSQHLSTGNISSLRSLFETTSSPLSPSTSKEKISVSASTEKTKVKKIVKKKASRNSEE